jgi:hypothetical protein
MRNINTATGLIVVVVLACIDLYIWLYVVASCVGWIK